MRRAVLALGMIALMTSLAAALAAQEPDDGHHREAAALEFVREHHRELADLLVPLKAMDREQYDAAIRDLARTRENIERMEKRDPGRAALALASWKAGSRVELLTARLISRPDPRLEAELRRALEDQLAAQLAVQKYERDQLRKRLEQAEETIRRLERRGDAMVESRLSATLKKVQRVRRQAGDGGEAASADPPGRPARPEGGRP